MSCAESHIRFVEPKEVHCLNLFIFVFPSSDNSDFVMRIASSDVIFSKSPVIEISPILL